MAEKIKGSFYTATIDKSEVVASDGTILDFRIDISCENGDLFKELIEYIELFHEECIRYDIKELLKDVHGDDIE